MVRKLREKHDGALTRRMDIRVWLRMLSCSTIIEKRLRRRMIEQFNTTLPRFDILATLDRYPDGVAMGTLSRTLLVSNGNVTPIVRQLEEAGFASLSKAEDDGRSLVVSLTPAGRDHFAIVAKAHHRWISTMFEGLDESDLTNLFSILAKLKTSIAMETSGEGEGKK